MEGRGEKCRHVMRKALFTSMEGAMMEIKYKVMIGSNGTDTQWM